MEFRGKTIFVISPEPWGKLLISKHNYALALAERGNMVFFFNPFNPYLKPGTLRTEVSVHPRLLIIHSRPLFPLFLKFHAKKLFDLLLKWHVRIVKRQLKARPDIVWDFYCSYLYHDLSVFGARLNIFQPVDHLATDVRDKQADLVVSISDNLLQQYTGKGVPRLKVNHGLSLAFVPLAQRAPRTNRSERPSAGYVGNLTISSLDRENFLRLVEFNPGVDFNIIGPVLASENNLGTNSDEGEFGKFVQALRSHGNVFLLGAMSQLEIADMLDQFDVLLVCYRHTPTYSNDNSHKILEYLASGRIIVSTYLSAYRDSGLLAMSPEGRNDEWPALFAEVLRNLGEHNSAELQLKRKAYALQNTYEQQIVKIEAEVNNHAGPGEKTEFP